MNLKTLTLAAGLALLPLAAAADDRSASSSASDETAASVDALKHSLPSTDGFEVDQVRVTESGVACIDYRVASSTGGQTRGHAVVKGDDVQRSTMGNSRFEKAWKENCLGPRGGMKSGD